MLRKRNSNFVYASRFMYKYILRKKKVTLTITRDIRQNFSNITSYIMCLYMTKRVYIESCEYSSLFQFIEMYIHSSSMLYINNMKMGSTLSFKTGVVTIEKCQSYARL